MKKSLCQFNYPIFILRISRNFWMSIVNYDFKILSKTFFETNESYSKVKLKGNLNFAINLNIHTYKVFDPCMVIILSFPQKDVLIIIQQLPNKSKPVTVLQDLHVAIGGKTTIIYINFVFKKFMLT